MCMTVCGCVPKEARKGHWSPLELALSAIVSLLVWILGIQFKPSARLVCS